MLCYAVLCLKLGLVVAPPDPQPFHAQRLLLHYTAVPFIGDIHLILFLFVDLLVPRWLLLAGRAVGYAAAGLHSLRAQWDRTAAWE